MNNIQFLIWLSFSMFLSCQTEPKSDENVKQENDKVSVEDVEAGIRANIDQKVNDGNGFFNFSNDSLKLSLKLVRVHTEYLSVLRPNEFFACVDLATESGDVYDVDFFLKGEKDDMKITKTDIHKLNGKPYYTWKQKKDKSWHTVPVKQASNELLGVIEGEDSFTFNYQVILPEIEDSSEIWIPLAQSDQFQNIEVLSIDAPIEMSENQDSNGNMILYTKLNSQNSGDTISITYEVIRKEKGPYPDESMELNVFLKATPLLPVGDRFALIANEVIMENQATTDLTKARALYDYVIDNVKYAKQGKYGTGDANYACDSKSGNCTEFHSLFISLARSADIPARFAVGAAIPSERNEGGVNGYHCWAEFYAEGKWWPVDISEANKYTPLATYYFGHHPANRIEFSRGRHLTLDPKPNSGPVNFLAYPLLEVGGEIAPVKTIFTFNRDNQNIES